jgi:hypothetical protein
MSTIIVILYVELEVCMKIVDYTVQKYRKLSSGCCSFQYYWIHIAKMEAVPYFIITNAYIN